MRDQPLIGYRMWKVIKPHFLSSPSEVWMPREAMEASCPRGPETFPQGYEHSIVSPERSCSCGIYTVKSWGHLANYFNIRDSTHLDHAGVFVGTVKIWGKVIHHPQGYRSQFAYPREIYAVSSLSAPLAPLMGHLYGVPAHVGFPADFEFHVPPPRIPREASRRPEKEEPSIPYTQYSILRSELPNLMKIAEKTILTGQIARILLENLDDDFSVTGKVLYEALVAAKQTGRLRTTVHPWAAFEARKASYTLFSRSYCPF